MPHQCTDCGRQFDDGSKEMLSGCPSCGGNKFQFLPGSGNHPGQPPDREKRRSGTDSFEESTSSRVERSVARKVGNAATAVRDLVGSSSAQQPDSIGREPVSEYEPAEPTAGQSADGEPDTPRPPATDRNDDLTDREISRPEQFDEDRRHSSPSTNTGGDSRRDGTDTGEKGDTAVSERTDTVTEGVPTRGVQERAERPAENAAQASARSDVVSPDDLPDSASTTSQTPWPSERERSSSTPNQEAQRDDNPDDQAATERPDLSELRAELNQQFESIKVLEPGQYELNLMELFDREEYIVALQEDGKYTVQVPESFQK